MITKASLVCQKIHCMLIQMTKGTTASIFQGEVWARKRHSFRESKPSESSYTAQSKNLSINVISGSMTMTKVTCSMTRGGPKCTILTFNCYILSVKG